VVVVREPCAIRTRFATAGALGVGCIGSDHLIWSPFRVPARV
jgi:hypothetical protein